MGAQWPDAEPKADYDIVIVGAGGHGLLPRLTCNKNAIPFEPEKPAATSGVHLGSATGTTRGFGEAEVRQVGAMVR